MIARFSAYGFLKNLQLFEPFLYIYFLSKGFSFFQIGILVSVREISVYIIEIPTGIFADLFGKKNSMILCFCSYIASFVVFGISSSFYSIAGAMAVFGIGEAFRTGTHKAIIMDYLDSEGISDRKVHVYGYTRSWAKIGSAVSALAAAGLVFLCVKESDPQYNIIFLASIVPYAAGLILMFTYPQDKPERKGAGIIALCLEHRKESLKALKKNTVLLLNSTVFDGLFKVGRDFIQPIIKQAAVAAPLFAFAGVEKKNALLIGITYFLVSILSAVCARYSGKFRDVFGRGVFGENILFVCAGILYLGLALTVYTGMLWVTIFLFLLSVSLFNLRRPLLVSHVGDRVEKEQRATVFSVESMLKTFIVALCAPVVGKAADKWGLYVIFVITGTLILLLSFPLRFKNNGRPSGAGSIRA
ncbi:MFS transporter [Planctomycetota bacterium]